MIIIMIIIIIILIVIVVIIITAWIFNDKTPMFIDNDDLREMRASQVREIRSMSREPVRDIRSTTFWSSWFWSWSYYTNIWLELTGQCPETCARAWLENLNRRLAIFPESYSGPLRRPPMLSECHPLSFHRDGAHYYTLENYFTTTSLFRSLIHVIAEEE